jgi:hypothetical protein
MVIKKTFFWDSYLSISFPIFTTFHTFFVGKQKKNFQDWRLNKKWRGVRMKLVINRSLSEVNLKRAELWHWHSQPPCWILYGKWLPPAVRFICSKTHWSFSAWVFICSIVVLISDVYVLRYVRDTGPYF